MKNKKTKIAGRIEDNPVYVPVDKKAAMVIGTGEHFDIDLSGCANVFDTPPQIRPVPRGYRFNLVGVRFGRFIVIGLVAARRTNLRQYKRAKARWVCKCDCGKYVIFKTKSIRNPSTEQNEGCPYCYRLNSLINGKV